MAGTRSLRGRPVAIGFLAGAKARPPVNNLRQARESPLEKLAHDEGNSHASWTLLRSTGPCIKE
jgi:hypothetical protein